MRVLPEFWIPEPVGDIREELAALYSETYPQWVAFNQSNVGVTDIIRPLVQHLPSEIQAAVHTAATEVFINEPLIRGMPSSDFRNMSAKDLEWSRWQLYARRYFFQNQAVLLAYLKDRIRTAFEIFKTLHVTTAPSPFSVRLGMLFPNPGLAIVHLEWGLRDTEYSGEYRPFANIVQRIADNSARVDAPLDPIDRTLPGTPLHKLFSTPVSVRFSQEDRFNHMHIVAGSGVGKTVLLETMILQDIQSEDPPTTIVVDPHSDLIRKLTHADLGIEDRLIIIDPRDVDHPPAVNIFAMNQARLGSYDEVTREQVTAGVIQTFDYLFAGLFGMDLTGKQQVFFRYVTRLMLTLPDVMGRNATILDMLHLMSDPAPYQEAIRRLPDVSREFFERDFNSKTFAQTKEQIRYRLLAIIENPTLERLFTAQETKLDLFTEMNRGAVILVDTAKDFLKGNSAIFGRIFISLVLQAVLERAAIAERDRKPTFMFIDEAADVFDTNIDDLLTEARKYKAGLVLAHQYLDQASSSLRASLAANTGIKFASGLSSHDARQMAPELRTTADFIMAQPRLQFAAHIRNVTPQALPIPIQVGAIDRVPKLSEEAFTRLMNRNHARVSQSPRVVTPSLRAVAEEGTPFVRPASPGPGEDISSEW